MDTETVVAIIIALAIIVCAASVWIMRRLKSMADFRTAQLALIFPSMTRLDLTDLERDELVRALRGIVDGDRFPLSPRIRRLKAILQKLVPPAPASEPFPAPKPPGEPSRALNRPRRR